MMRRTVVFTAFTALALLVGIPPAGAQTVDEIIARNIEAKGGLEKLKSTTSVRMTGTATVQGSPVPMTTVSKRPNLMRNEIEMGGQKLVQAFDGTTMWLLVPGMPAQEVPAGPQTEMLKRHSQFDPVFIDYKEKGHKIELQGKETDGGKDVYHLVVTPKDGPVAHYYIDVATGLETKMITDIEDPSMKAKMEMRMSDYRNVEGRMVPFAMTHVVNGSTVGEMKFDKVEFNVPLDDTMFKMPK
jgi:outer membrane lipoprotein-sorting protein